MSNGARVTVIFETPMDRITKKAREISPSGKVVVDAPSWWRVGKTLAMHRIQEYLDETGSLPDEKLLEDFQREMGKRLDAYIRAPMKHPFMPMGLAEFEKQSTEFRVQSAD